MWPCHFTPDDPYLGSTNLPLCAVNESNFLSEVEAVDTGLVSATMRTSIHGMSYVAALGSSTPSILIRLRKVSVY